MNKELLSIITKTCINIFIVTQITLIIIFPIEEAAQYLKYTCIFLGTAGCLCGIIVNDWAIRIIGIVILFLSFKEIFGEGYNIIASILIGLIFGTIDYLVQENEQE